MNLLRLFNTNTGAEITNAPAAASYLAWSDQFQADFDAISAALQRPYARMDADYSQPLAIPFPNITAISAVVKTLVQRANCHLLVGQTEKAQFTASSDGFWTRTKKHPEMLIFTLAPRGVMHEMFASKARNFRNMINSLSPINGMIRPGDASKASAWWKRAQEGLPLLFRTQTQVNEAQIACALERYRLVRREYPEALETLVPQFIEKLPRDIINGEPLIYHRTEPGNFLLYSVGWNETDDDGIPSKTLTDNEQGDWVWQNPAR